jgi:PAS domain S-box-containing protein
VVERKRVEEALRMSEVRFRELADLLPQMVFETDEKGILTFFNRVGLLLTGYTDEEINGGFDVFQLFPPEDAERAIESMRRVLGGDQTGPREYDLLKKDGSRFPVLLYSSPIIRNGKPVGLRGIILDMTEQKLMEEKLLRSKHLAAIGEAAAMVGHDLRNPLQGMTGAVYILKTERHLSEDGKAMLALIEEDIQRSDKIVSDLLDYSRELHLDLSTSNPKSLMEQSLASLKIPENIRIVDHTDEQPTVEMDVEKLSRVCVNLLKNACDAMPKGGTLTITSTESDDTVWLSFADNGEGMSEETLSKIWRPLFTTKARGMGYGLAVVKRFVEAHEGTVKVESKLGRGSTFTISLPIKQKTTSN